MDSPKYILNPAYFLRNDLRRSIIGAYDFPIVHNDELYDRNFVYITHPLIAQILSFFNGCDTIENTVVNISKTLGVQHCFVNEFVDSICENEYPILNEYDGCDLILPKKVLVPGSFHDRREHYTYTDFIVDGDIDLINKRLYKPTKIIIELTLKCFTKCIYCYADKQTRYEQLPTSRIISIIKEAHSLGIPSIEMNGGEVLLHPDIKEIIEALDAHGYHPFISTKLPIDSKMLLFLKEHNFTNIQISLDSIHPHTLSSTLAVKDTYIDKLLNTIETIDNEDFIWQVNVVLTKFNISLHNEIMPLMNLLMTYKNLKGIKIVPAAYSMYNSKDNFKDIKASLFEIDCIKQYVDTLNAEKVFDFDVIFDEPECQHMYSPQYKEKRFPKRAYCTANQRAFNILPDGKVTICEELYWNQHFIIGDLSVDTIESVWNSARALELFHLSQESIDKNSQCATCQLYNDCRHDNRVCWKLVVAAYGHDKWDFPDPRCPLADYPYINYLY